MAQESYSDEVLEGTPGRVTDFLLGIGADAAIRTILANAGMTDADIDEGKSLLLASFGKKKPSAAEQDTVAAKAQRDAVAALSPLDEDLFPRARAVLSRFSPEAGAFLLGGLQVQESANDSVTVLATFCTNYRTLEKGRAGKEEQDKKALEALKGRNITTEKIAEIEALLAVAFGPTTVKEASNAREERRAVLSNLKVWYDDWAATAHSVIKKRGQLIRLGLAKRRSPKKEEPTA
jgi:hypothetical protein